GQGRDAALHVAGTASAAGRRRRSSRPVFGRRGPGRTADRQASREERPRALGPPVRRPAAGGLPEEDAGERSEEARVVRQGGARDDRVAPREIVLYGFASSTRFFSAPAAL